MDAKPFDAKLDKTGVFSAAIPGQVLETAKQKTLTAQRLENDVVKKSVDLTYQVNTSANMSGGTLVLIFHRLTWQALK